MAQMYVEGVAYKALKVGASSKVPRLRIATPVAVPLVSSSNRDCSQVRVPSAKAGCTTGSRMRASKKTENAKKRDFQTLGKFKPRIIRMGNLRVPRQAFSGPQSGPARALTPDAQSMLWLSVYVFFAP